MAGPGLLACGAVKSILERYDWPGGVDWGTVGALRDRVLAGERPGVVILSDAALSELVEAGLVRAEGIVPLGRAETGLAVRDGVERRAIDTAGAFAAALLAAERVGWADGASGATAGKHFEGVLRTLGIEDAVRAKAVLFRFGVEAVAACGRGEVELAVSQATEIVGRPGVSLLGPFPAPFGLITGYAAAALEDSERARALMDALGAPAVRQGLAEIGFV